MPEKVEELLKKYSGDYDKFVEAEGASYKPSKLKSIKDIFDKSGAQYGTQKNVAKASFASTENDKGDSSLAGNKDAQAISSVYDKLTLLPSNADTKAIVNAFNEKGKKVLKENRGKSDAEKEKSASEIISEFSGKKEERPIPIQSGQLSGSSVIPSFSNVEKEIEKAGEKNKISNKENSFIRAWASTHPTWRKILTSDELTWGQKVQLVGGAIAQMGANVTMGALSGFNRTGFTPVEWDFKKAVDKYTNQELENVLAPEQQAKGKKAYQDFFYDMAQEYGDDKMQEMFKILDAYGDNPEILKSRLEALGIKQDAEEIKKAYANREKVTAQEQTKREKIETQLKSGLVRLQQLDAKIKQLESEGIAVDTKVKAAVSDGLINATNAQNAFNKVKYSSDADTYKLEKYAGYVNNVLNTVSSVAAPILGAVVPDGIIKAKGIPQKLVRADGTEIQLDPNDNVYATVNELTTEKDNGAGIIYMDTDDRAVTVQKKLGYNGGVINKDFDYYLSKLRG